MAVRTLVNCTWNILQPAQASHVQLYTQKTLKKQTNTASQFLSAGVIMLKSAVLD